MGKKSFYGEEYGSEEAEMKPLKKKKKKRVKTPSEADVQGAKMAGWKKKGFKSEC